MARAGKPQLQVRTPEQIAEMNDEALLAIRVSELGLTVRDSPLQEKIQLISQELRARGLAFRPYYWLSDEWFSPEGYPGVAIPFYLAHPRLAKLELSQMLEVEGGTHEWCMKILRHEVGHAIDHAFRLQRNKKRRRVFGSPSVAYPEFYAPKPYSKSFVQHLDSWYAQSHPDEDFAETFAVWLTPGSDWHERYQGWPALKKLKFMDELMLELKAKAPAVRTRATLDPITRIHRTLGEHYQMKRERYAKGPSGGFDRELRRLFSDLPQHEQNRTAASFIKRVRKDVRATVARWTGQYQYRINQVLDEMISRCEDLKLRTALPDDQARTDFAVLLTVQTMNYLHSGRHRIAL